MTRRLSRNLGTLYSAEVAAKALGVVIFGALAQRLGPETYGRLGWALSVVFLLNLIQEAGLAPYGAREATRDPSQLRTLAARIICVRILLLIPLAALVFLAAGLVDDSKARVLWYCALTLLPAPLMLNWVFQSRDEMRVVAASSVLRQGVLAIGVLAFVHSAEDVRLAPVFDAVALLVVVVLQQGLFRRLVGRPRFQRVRSGITRVAREAAPLAASSIAWAVRLFAPVILMGAWSTDSEVGYFESGHRLVISIHAFVWLFFFNLLPTLTRLLTREDLGGWRALMSSSQRLVAWAAPGGCLALTALAPVLVTLIYGDAFAHAVLPFQLQLWMLAVAFVSGHHRFSLIASGNQGSELLSSFAGALTCTVACVAFSDDLTPTIAAVILVLSELVTCLSAMRLLGRTVEPARSYRFLVKPLVVLAPVAWLILGPLGEHAILGAATAAAVTVAGLLLLERGLLQSLSKLSTIRS